MSYRFTLYVAITLLFWVFCVQILYASPAVIADTMNCSTPKIMKKIKHNITSIKNYQLKTTVSLDGNQVTSNISGTPPNLMRIGMNMQQGNTLVKISTVFDGAYQWIETKYPTAIEVFKIKLAGLINPQRPFDTTYYIQGSGLLSGEDYPSSVSILLNTYELKANCSPSEIRLSGPLNIANFTKYAARKKSSVSVESRLKQYTKHFARLTTVFNASTLALEEYYLGTQSNPKYFSVKIDSLRINQKLGNTEYVYIQPQGVVAIDITADLLERLQK